MTRHELGTVCVQGGWRPKNGEPCQLIGIGKTLLERKLSGVFEHRVVRRSSMLFRGCDDVIAFKDIHPQAPVHFLIVPKKHIVSLAETQPADEPLLGKMLGLVRKLAKEQGCDNGFRVIINTGRDGGQEVPHLHIHVLGGPRPWKK